MINRFLRPALAALFLGVITLHAAIPAAENLLPGDTLAFFTVPDCAAARTAAKSSPGWMFWADPAMKPFREKLMGKLNDQLIAPLERDLGVKVGDFMDFPQGQFTLAVTVNGSTGNDDIPPGLLLLLDSRDRSDSLKTNLAVLVKKWTDAGRALRTEKIRGLNFTVVPLASNDLASLMPKKVPVSELGKDSEPEKPAKPSELYFTQYQSLLVLGNAATVVETVAAHLTGGSEPAIADNPIFSADRGSQFRDNPQYYGWFNCKSFLSMITLAAAKESDDDSMSPFSVPKVLAAVGLNSVRSISLALHDTHEGSTLTVHATAPESERAGLAKILALPSKDTSVPPFVPADAIKFTRIRLDGKQAWAEIEKMVARITPSGQAQLNAVITFANSMAQQKYPGFDLRKDLVGNLGDDLITYQKPVSGQSLTELADPPTLILFAASNPEAVINAVKVLTSLGGGPGSDASPRDFLGRKIYSITLKAAASATPGAAPRSQTLYLASGNGYVAVSSDSPILEEFLRNADGKNQQLRDNPALQAALQHLGGSGNGMFSYENQRETMRITFKAVKNSLAAGAGNGPQKLLEPTLREWFDFSLLPDFDLVSKYFYISTVTAGANSEGLTFKAFAPRSPQLN